MPALREAALEQEHEARPDEQHQQRVAVERGSRAAAARDARSYSASGHRVDLAGPALVEVAGVRVVEAVLALPPAVGREQQEAEQVAPARVGRPRLEHRVVGEVVEERVHPHEEHGRDQPEADGEPRRPAARSRRGPRRRGRAATTLAIWPRLRAAVDLQVGGEVAASSSCGRGSPRWSRKRSSARASRQCISLRPPDPDHM